MSSGGTQQGGTGMSGFGRRSPFSSGYGGQQAQQPQFSGWSQPLNNFMNSPSMQNFFSGLQNRQMSMPTQNQQYRPMGNAYAYGQQMQQPVAPPQGSSPMGAQVQRPIFSQPPVQAQPMDTRSLYEQQMGIFPNGRPQQPVGGIASLMPYTPQVIQD